MNEKISITLQDVVVGILTKPCLLYLIIFFLLQTFIGFIFGTAKEFKQFQIMINVFKFKAHWKYETELYLSVMVIKKKL